MKIKLKLIIDALLLGAILVCMKYDFTGGLIHELLGFALVAGLIAHVVWNRKYYIGMVKALARTSLGFKQKIAFVINIILLVALIVMIITSVAISKDVLVFLNLNVSNYMLWYVLHVASAIALMVCALIHTFLHGKLIRTVISSTLKSGETKALCNGAVRVAAVILAVLVIKTSFTGGLQLADRISSASMVQGREQNVQSEEISEGNSSQDYNDSEDVTAGSNSQDYGDQEASDSTDSGDAPSLEEYLGNLFCTECGRCCSLLSIRCGRGYEPVQRATQEYYEIYGSEQN